MGDDESEENPRFEGATDTGGEDSGPSGTPADDADEQQIPSTDQWDWVETDKSQSDHGDDPEDGERVWNQFEDAEQDANTATDGTADRQTSSGEKSPPPPSADTQPGEMDDGLSPESDGSNRAEEPSPPSNFDDQSGDTGRLPEPPTADGQPDDADTTPGPARQDIQEMQPLYKRRTKEFYLLWLGAALSYGLGDMVTTSYVFVTPRVGESNPVIKLVLEQSGLGGFVAAKFAIFGFLLAISVKSGIEDERLSYYGPPVLAVLVGMGLTVWNLKIILGL